MLKVGEFEEFLGKKVKDEVLKWTVGSKALVTKPTSLRRVRSVLRDCLQSCWAFSSSIRD